MRFGNGLRPADNRVETALAHSIGSAVEAAYRRGDLFEKRRELMADWGVYCSEERPMLARQSI